MQNGSAVAGTSNLGTSNNPSSIKAEDDRRASDKKLKRQFRAAYLTAAIVGSYVTMQA